MGRRTSKMSMHPPKRNARPCYGRLSRIRKRRLPPKGRGWRMRAGQAERTDIPAGNEKSSGGAFSLSVGKYVVRACATKTDGQLSSEKARHFGKVRNFQSKLYGVCFHCLVATMPSKNRVKLFRLICVQIWTFPFQVKYSLTLFENNVSISSTSVCGILCGQEAAPHL